MNSDPVKEEAASEEWARFKRFARALFRVDKRDVPKHEPKKRVRRTKPAGSENTP